MPALIKPLGLDHRPALHTLLMKEATNNLYFLGLLEEFGVVPQRGTAPFEIHGRFDGGNLTAALFVGYDGGLLVPSYSAVGYIGDIARALAGKVRLRGAVGETALVDTLATYLGQTEKRKTQKAQRLYTVSADDLGPHTNPTLRLATESDLRQLLPLAAASVKEMFARDPLLEDPRGFAERVRRRVRENRTYVLEDKGRLVFKLDIGSRSQAGAELEGLYTVPQERGKGHATLCLGQISRHLLSSLPRLAIRIDDNGMALTAIARKVGYIAGRPQKVLLLE